MSKQPQFLSLPQRQIDYFLIVCFSIFASTSFFISSLSAFNIPVTSESKFFLIRWLYQYGVNIDSVVLKNPLYLQIQSFIDCFVFGPFYLLLIYAFIRRKSWIRIPAIIYVATMTYSMILYLGIELMGENAPLNQSAFLGLNFPYLVIPLVLGSRMRKTDPFN